VTVCATDACDGSARLASATTRARFRGWAPQQSADGVTLQVFPNLSNRAAYHWQLFLPIGFAGYLRRSAASFDVAHLHAHRNVPGAIAAYYLQRAGVPYVLAPNGTALRIERRRFAKLVFDAAVGFRTARGASRMIAVSHAEGAQLRSIGVKADAIRLVPNPIELDEFTPPPARGTFRRRVAAEGALILFLGRLSPRKRVDDLVRAFARLIERPSARDVRTARLVIAGNDAGAAGSARRLARQLGVEERTVFTGLLRGRERLEALADADVVVYPSADEIFGLVPLEALLCGTPVIVADDSGCAEVVRAVGGGQVVPLADVDALTCAIADVLARPTCWRAAATEAGGRVRAAYGTDVVCAQLDDVYRELVPA
jgi:glycosyltransferase involved in cell wall biosynthesis